MNSLIHIAAIMVFAAIVVVPFFARKPGPSFADGTQEKPTIQAKADLCWAFDCSGFTSHTAFFVPRPESEVAIRFEILRQDKRDHGTGAEIRPS